MKFLMGKKGVNNSYEFTISGSGDIIDVSQCDISKGVSISDHHILYAETYDPAKVLRYTPPIAGWSYRISPEYCLDRPMPVLIVEQTYDGLKFSTHIALYSISSILMTDDTYLPNTLKNPASVRLLVKTAMTYDPEFYWPTLFFRGEWDITIDFTNKKPCILVSQDGNKPEKRSPGECTILDNFSQYIFGAEIVKLLPFSPTVGITEQIKFLTKNPSMWGIKAFPSASAYNKCKGSLGSGSTPEDILGVDKRLFPFISYDITTEVQLRSYQIFCNTYKDDLDEVLRLYTDHQHRFSSLEDFISWALNLSGAEELRREIGTYRKSGIDIRNKHIAITGTLSTMTRNTMIRKLQAAGALFDDAVTRYTDYLLVGDRPGDTKLNKAEKYNIRKISEREINWP